MIVTEIKLHYRSILDNAVVSKGMEDIFALAGLQKPNIGLLSKEFLEDVRNMPHKNLAVELLEKLLMHFPLFGRITEGILCRQDH